jgi:hypothetical protein
VVWGWLIDNWSWANGEAVLRSGKPLLDLSVRDMMYAGFRLFIDWACMTQEQKAQVDSIHRYFRDRETEYETGELVLPGWAQVGNVAAQYGLNDGADPFASPSDTDHPQG